MAPRPLNILICGGGIAGPAAAFWLSKLGHSCTIVERHGQLRAQGQQIDIRDQGISVVRRMGLLDEIRNRSVDEEGALFVDAVGKPVAFFGRTGDEEHQGFTSEFEIMRGELCRILHEATRDRVAWRFEVTVDELEHVDDGRRVRAVFSDGEAAEYDLVIGADGQGSRVRRNISPEDQYRALGLFCCYFNMPRDADDKRKVFTMYVADKRRNIGTRWHSDKFGQGYLMTMSHADEMRRALRQADGDAQKDLFARVFRGAGWQADRLVHHMRQADDVYTFEALQVTTQPWSKGRIVLLGDAGYAPSFCTGMGTTLAFVGAYVLAGELSRHGDDIPAALAAYDEELRPFVEKAQQLPPGFPSFAFPKSGWGVRLMNWILAIMVLIRFDAISAKLARLLPEGKKWKLPDYPALQQGDVKEKGEKGSTRA
ncbi:hypothetical protein CDD83_7993 [Cordyceps sp. RAO-2017]|nr:hypothetical protein CDD83_7993 [Cordyceps sp. RAO-2017]